MKLKLLFSLIFCIFLVGCDAQVDENEDTVPEETEPQPIYFPITIGSPSADTLIMAGTTFRYTVNGGKPPYRFTYISGPGQIDADGNFNAGTIAGNTIIDINDSANQVLRVRVRVNPMLTVTPTNAKLNVGQGVLLETTGGVPPYTYFIESGGGFINGLGYYVANNTPGSAVIKIYDSQGNFVTNTVQVNYPVSIDPVSIDLNRGETFMFSATNGFPPYSYQVIGGGVMNAITGVLKAPPTSQNLTVRVTDSMGNLSNSMVVVNNRPLSMNAVNLVMEVNKSFAFKADGGLAPYLYQMVTGPETGTLLPSGIYYAPSNPVIAEIKAIDSEGTEVLASIQVNQPLTISPSTMITTPNRSEQLFASGGVPPYQFVIISGAGVVDNTSENHKGIFTAPGSLGNTVVQLRDSVGTTINAQIKIDPSLAISPTLPSISVGNQIIFIGSGGVPPYEFDICNGNPPAITNCDGSPYGSIDPDNGTFVVTSGLVLTEPVEVLIRLRDTITSDNFQAKFTKLTITPQIAFTENPIIVTSGDTKEIQATGGVPPYTLRFKNGSSLIGSSIQNVPNGGGYTMRYTAGFVAEDIVEKLEITDSLNNKVEQNVTAFGGLLAFYDSRKMRISSSRTIGVGNITLTNNSDLANIYSSAHGLNNTSFIKMRNSEACANIDDYEFDRQYNTTLGDTDNFLIKLLRRSNQTTTCGMGSSYTYDVLSNGAGQVCSPVQEMDILNLRNYTLGGMKAKCVNGQSPFTGEFNSFIMNRTNNNYLNLNLPTSNEFEGFVSVEMWLKWDGNRAPLTNPETASFNGTIVSFNNYNVSFMTVKNANNAAIQSICFNTTPALDCYGTNNVDALVKNRWTHFVFVFSNSDVINNKIYINGQERALNKQGTADYVSRFTTGIFRIGSNVNYTGTYYQIGGELAFVRVYDKSLNSSEVFNNYYQYKPVFSP